MSFASRLCNALLLPKVFTASLHTRGAAPAGALTASAGAPSPLLGLDRAGGDARRQAEPGGTGVLDEREREQQVARRLEVGAACFRGVGAFSGAGAWEGEAR